MRLLETTLELSKRFLGSRLEILNKLSELETLLTLSSRFDSNINRYRQHPYLVLQQLPCFHVLIQIYQNDHGF